MGTGHVDAHGGNKGVALLIAVLALVLAFSETLGKAAQTTATAANIEASNLWAFFQAKTIRQTTLRTAAEQMELSNPGERGDEADHEVERNRRALPVESPRPARAARSLPRAPRPRSRIAIESTTSYHHYEVASAAVQIAIVLASASIITTMPVLVWLAGALGVMAIAFCVIGFWFPAAVHLF